MENLYNKCRATNHRYASPLNTARQLGFAFQRSTLLAAAVAEPGRYMRIEAVAMTDAQINQIVDEIENVSAQQFWWDSELLERASRVRDARVVSALVLRHHALGNK